MRHKCIFVLILGAGIASPQSVPAGLVSYLSLTDPQVQSINSLNNAFNKYTNTQQNQYFQLQLQALAELARDSPDPGTVGSLYGQMAMISRDYSTQLAQVQSNVAAVLTTGQVMQVSGLLDVVRLQPLVSEALCISMETGQALGGIPTIYDPAAQRVPLPTSTSTCSVPPVPTALVNYFNLSDAQVSSIENAIQGNQDYLNRQALKIQELQYEIQDLTAAQTIDTVALGADFVTITQIQRDETTQAGQLGTTVRGVLTDPQQPLLKALDNAQSMFGTASEAVSNNLLVLPPDLAQSCLPGGVDISAVLIPVFPNPFPTTVCGDFLLGIPYPGNIIPTNAPTIQPRYTGHGTKDAKPAYPSREPL